MVMSQQGFYIHLPSNNIHTSRENKTSHFFTELPTELDFTGHWEVGLAEVDIPISWYNLPHHPVQDRTLAIIQEEVKLKEGVTAVNSFNDVFTQKDTFKVYVIPYGNFEIKGLVEAINNCFKQRDQTKDAIYDNFKRNSHITIHPQNLKPALHVGVGDSILLSKCLSEILRFDCCDGIIRAEGAIEFKGPLLNQKNIVTYQQLLASQSSGDFHTNSFYSSGVPYFSSDSSNIYIYCNIVDFEVVGNIYTRLLRTVKTIGKFGAEIQHIYINPHYKKVSQTKVKDIEIMICDDQGELVKFEYGKVLLVLHFRKVE